MLQQAEISHSDLSASGAEHLIGCGHVVCANHKNWNFEHSWLSHFSVISFSAKYWVSWELCIGCPLILILHTCSNYVVAQGFVSLISGNQNVPFLFVLEGNILGRGNSKLEIGSNSNYLTLLYTNTYSVIMTVGNVSIQWCPCIHG
jgi:hypothetical protein